MNIELTEKDTRDLVPTDIIFQTSFWGRFKTTQGWKPMAFDVEAQFPSGDMLVLVKSLADGVPIAYVPQGPEYGPAPEHYGPFLESLSNALINHLDSKPAFIRYDLPWPDHYDPSFCGRPCGSICFERPEPRLRELRMNFGTNLWNLKKAAFDFSVADSLVIDLDSEEDVVLARMKHKTRYNIRLAEKKGVKVFDSSVEMLPVFYDLYVQTARRNRFTVCGYNRFSSLFKANDASPCSPELIFLLAGYGKEILAGAIVGITGATAVYMFGASSNHYRNIMAPYSVQWQAIRLAQARGCTVYDMGAVSPTKDPTHPFYGMFRFKTGFGGRIVHKAGSWDYPYNLKEYERFRTYETIGQLMGY